MKNIKYSFGLLMAFMMVFSSCRDFVEPNIPYATFDTGVYLRTIRSAPNTSTNFNFFELANSRFALTLEAVDAEGGTTVSSVEIRVRHRRLIPGVGLEYVPAGSASQVNDVLIATLSGSDFQPGAENPNHPTQNYTRATFEIPALEAIQAVGLTPAQIQGGDTFEFRMILTDNKGRVFGPNNRSADVAGGLFYDSPFLYNVNVVCPSNISTATDVWQATGTSRFGTRTAEVRVTPVSGQPTQWEVSDVSAGLYAGFGFNATQSAIYNDACNVISFLRAGTTQFSITGTGQSGSFDPATGTMIIYWQDAPNNIQGETILVKQ